MKTIVAIYEQQRNQNEKKWIHSDSWNLNEHDTNHVSPLIFKSPMSSTANISKLHTLSWWCVCIKQIWIEWNGHQRVQMNAFILATIFRDLWFLPMRMNCHILFSKSVFFFSLCTLSVRINYLGLILILQYAVVRHSIRCTQGTRKLD